ncbi:6,7-dimethyl-8-ribityllumazine synthase [Methylocella sp. CPCC 101449]|uniref:6,7-dimethyl-8-ribityllumazine synthase n=1 Tax=Methylocella sp. CPCC 101449 TaxID=2987531 RepID=UPI00288F2A47|nr:6,7-dimethyl-8-ribityllumazine synthase [Methylocella sp. CPCC 101449]MDT2022489.1 6,7-dimethyl-8-ribityllumazine synthase [Methylocella sp. CPCC 101449]
MAEPRRSTSQPLPRADGARFLIVEARYYDAIGDMLLNGAKAALQAAGASWDIIGVPGSLEIPAAVRIATADGAYAGALALGCVIRGETYHFEIVANESSRGLMDLSVAQQLPIGNGILTVENEEQAIVRADPKQGDKGGDAARAALSLYQLKRSVVRS